MNAVAAGEMIRTSATRLLPAEFLHAMLLIVAHGSCVDHSGRHCVSAAVLMNEPYFDPSQFLDILSRNSGEVANDRLGG
jgi:hypothetical protein